MRDSMRWAPKFMLRGIWGSKYVLDLHHTIVRMFLSLSSFIHQSMIPFWKVRRFCFGRCTAVYRYIYVCIDLEQPIDRYNIITSSPLLGGTVVTLTRITSHSANVSSRKEKKKNIRNRPIFTTLLLFFFPSVIYPFFFSLSFRVLFHPTKQTLIRNDESIGAKKNKKKKEMSWEKSLHTVISIVYTDASWFM